MDSFLFVTKDVQFEETSPDGKFVRVSATFLELDKPSIGSDVKISKIYRFEEGKKIAESLVGKSVYYGTDWAGRHTDKHEIGVIEKAVKLGKKIKGIVKVWINDKSMAIVESLKKGGKFLFSVGGVAQFGELIVKAGKKIQKLFGAVCTHLQMVPSGTSVGFPDAKLEKIVEIQETVMVCEGDVCSILKEIKTCWGEEDEGCQVCGIPNTSEVIEIPTETLISDSLHIVPKEIVDEMFEEAVGEYLSTHVTRRIGLGKMQGKITKGAIPPNKKKNRNPKRTKRKGGKSTKAKKAGACA